MNRAFNGTTEGGQWVEMKMNVCVSAPTMRLQLPALLSKLKHPVRCLMFLTLTAGCFVVEATPSTRLQRPEVPLVSEH